MPYKDGYELLDIDRVVWAGDLELAAQAGLVSRCECFNFFNVIRS